MSINFLDTSCKTESNEKEFGLCDDPAPAKNPAYIDEHIPAKWIAAVHNPSNEKAAFYAVDHCVEVLRVDGDHENKCDGIFKVRDKSTIHRVERKSRQWLVGGR